MPDRVRVLNPDGAHCRWLFVLLPRGLLSEAPADHATFSGQSVASAAARRRTRSSRLL